MGEVHAFAQVRTPVPVSVKFLGIPTYHTPVGATAPYISAEAIVVDMEILIKKGALSVKGGGEPVNLIPFLFLNEKMLSVDIKVPRPQDVCKGVGRLVWYDFGTRDAVHFFRAMISLEKMSTEDRKRWEGFVVDHGSHEGKEKTRQEPTVYSFPPAFV